MRGANVCFWSKADIHALSYGSTVSNRMFMLAMAAVATPGAAVDPAVAEITGFSSNGAKRSSLATWDFVERLVAPEYRLVGASPDGKYVITRRAEWMKNAQAFKSYAFAVETVDVNRVGNTVVASAQGVWTVSRKAGEAPRATRFFVTDTWIRRGGHWQVMHRYSHRLPSARLATGDAGSASAQVRELSRGKPTCGDVRNGSKADVLEALLASTGAMHRETRVLCVSVSLCHRAFRAIMRGPGEARRKYR